MNDKQEFSFNGLCPKISKGNLQMRSQILILNGIILILLIPSLIIAQIINMEYVTQILTHYMKTCMAQDMYNHLSVASNSFESQIGAFFLKNQIYLTNMNQLYWLQLKTDFVIEEKFYRFCEIDQINHIEEYNYSIPCIAYFAFLNQDYEPQDPIEQILRNHTNLINSVAFGLLGIDYITYPAQIYFTSSIDSYTFGYYYPQIIRYSNYNPKQRIWYQEHFKNLENNNSQHTQISQIYQYFLAEPIYSITITQSMLNLDRQVEGIFGTDLQFTNNIIPKMDINVMVVKKTGQLLLTNYKNKAISNSSNLQNFYDEQITGFTKQDWNALLDFYYQNNYNSSCNLGQELFCRYNSVYKQDVVIKISQIQNLDYFIILFYDIEIEQSVMMEINYLVDLMKQEFQFFITITSGVSFILILIQIKFIYHIFLPLFQIINRSINLFNHKQNLEPFKQQFQKEKLKLQNIIFHKEEIVQNTEKINNVLIKLKIQLDTIFDRVLDSRSSINPQCQILQQFKYPLKNFEYRLSDDLNLSKIRNNYYDQSPGTGTKHQKKLKKSFSFKLESL